MPETTDKYHRIPVKKPKPNARIRTIDIDKAKGIKALYDAKNKENVTYLFDVKKWTMAQAKKWVKDHKTEKSLSDLNDFEFIMLFKNADTKNKDLMKALFREALSNRYKTLHFNKETDRNFLAIAQEVLPDLLWSTIKAKNAEAILSGIDTKIKSYEKHVIDAPYLLRKTGEDKPLGMVRLKSASKINKDMYEYEVQDYIPFFEMQKMHKMQLNKFNDEKMQMFSVVYRNYEAWNQPDTDDEYTTEEEIRKAVVKVAQEGIGLNIQHNNDMIIKDTDAQIIEFYQARTNWKEGDLEVRKGDLVATTQFFKTEMGKALWDDLKSGEYTTYSMEGNWYE